jgi:hypothetical protein
MEYPIDIGERYKLWLIKAEKLAKEMNLEIEFGYVYGSGYEASATAIAEISTTDTFDHICIEGRTCINY